MSVNCEEHYIVLEYIYTLKYHTLHMSLALKFYIVTHL